MDGTVGMAKADRLAERVAKIAPECEVTVEAVFFTEATMERLLKPEYDYIVDAIDATKHKCLLIAEARQAWARSSPAAARAAVSIRQSHQDRGFVPHDKRSAPPQVRKKLRREYGFPKHSRQKFKIDCVYSDELPVFSSVRRLGLLAEREPGTDYRLNCDEGLALRPIVTGTVGFFLAAEVVKRIALQG